MTLRENSLPQQAQFSLFRDPANSFSPPATPTRPSEVRRHPSGPDWGRGRPAFAPGASRRSRKRARRSPKTPRSRRWTGFATFSRWPGDRRRFRPGGRCASAVRRGCISARLRRAGARTTRANRQRLARELRAVLRPTTGGVPAARFRCCIAVARAGELCWRNSTAPWKGVVIPVAARGEGGVRVRSRCFIPAGYQETFAELPRRDQKPS